MKRNELIELRELVKNERDRRIRIKKLLDSELVKEYLLLNNIDPVILETDNIREIIDNILKTFTITETNGIYVCIRAYYIDCDICYEDTHCYTRDSEINSATATFRKYQDIENGKIFNAVKRKEDKRSYNYPFFSEFEVNNIVLNPYNKGEDNNGYDEVKYDFFNTAIKDGQAKAKKLVLSKYPRL